MGPSDMKIEKRYKKLVGEESSSKVDPFKKNSIPKPSHHSNSRVTQIGRTLSKIIAEPSHMKTREMDNSPKGVTRVTRVKGT